MNFRRSSPLSSHPCLAVACCSGGVGQSVTPPLIPGPLSLLSAVLAGGEVVAWMATSPLSSEIRTPLQSPGPGREGRGGEGRSDRNRRTDDRVRGGEW